MYKTKTKYKLILTSSSLMHSYDMKQLRIPNCQSAECFSQCSEHLNSPTWKKPTEAAVFSPKANAEQQSERLHLEQNLQNATVNDKKYQLKSNQVNYNHLKDKWDSNHWAFQQPYNHLKDKSDSNHRAFHQSTQYHKLAILKACMEKGGA